MLTTAPRQPEETSEVERRAAENGLSVKQFGYSFFYKPPETFLPVQAVPVGPNYVIGPGDAIRIIVWGSVQGEYALTVDRNGQIAIPKVGVVHVSGLTYRQLREVMDREFAHLYKNFQLNVTLDNLRTIPIYVVGQARFPGSYAVSSLSTLISALFAAGGPSKSGSMRDILVRRGKKVIVHFDMYDFLLRGDKSKDVRLQPGDVIFIPPIGPVAAIGGPTQEYPGIPAAQGVVGPGRRPQSLARQPGTVRGMRPESFAGQPGTVTGAEGLARTGLATQIVGGPVKVPGIYELRHERTLVDLLNLAGGLSDTAFKGRVQVLRVLHHQEMVLFEDDLNKVLSGRAPYIPLVDGDLVKIFPVSDMVEKKVRIAGAVKEPGEFGIQDRMRVKDLIAYAGGLLMQANQQKAEITRVAITPEGPVTSRIYINLRQALNGSPRDNVLLRPNDYVFVRTIPEWTLYSVVNVQGEVKYPGAYAIKKGETLSSLISRAGGYTDKAYIKGAFFTREAVREMQAKHLKEAIDRIEAEMLTTSTQKLETALEREAVEQQKAILARQQAFLAKLRTIQPLGRVVVHLDDPERLRGTADDLELQAGDTLDIPQIQQTVNVLGSVVNPTAVVYSPYLTVGDYLAQVGGPTKYADVKRLYVIKVNGTALSGSGGFFFGRRVSSARLDPGDTIVVPEELERVAWLKGFKDVATILGNIALAAGVAVAALK
jgi:polysaccharide export outer membrane protein